MKRKRDAIDWFRNGGSASADTDDEIQGDSGQEDDWVDMNDVAAEDSEAEEGIQYPEFRDEDF